MREKLLRMQLKFFSAGGRFELMDADLIRMATDQKDAAMILDPISPDELSRTEMGSPDTQEVMSYFDDPEIVDNDSIWTDDSESSAPMVFMKFK
jgi:capsule polysaccharide export protein KpsC/LpsZ